MCIRDRVVAWAQDIGLLDDSAYAKALARHYTAKGYGPYKIKDEFYRRQVPREDWEEALAAVEPPETWISDFLSRKIQDPEDPAQIKKASDALVRRGFSWHTVSQAVTRFLNGTDPW